MRNINKKSADLLRRRSPANLERFVWWRNKRDRNGVRYFERTGTVMPHRWRYSGSMWRKWPLILPERWQRIWCGRTFRHLRQARGTIGDVFLQFFKAFRLALRDLGNTGFIPLAVKVSSDGSLFPLHSMGRERVRLAPRWELPSQRTGNRNGLSQTSGSRQNGPRTALVIM